MKALWQRLETWALEHAGRSLHLRKGASAKALKAAEKTMKLALPADVRESLLAHDGQEAREDLFEWLPGVAQLKPLDEIVARWQEEDAQTDDAGAGEILGPLRRALWHRKRIPIAGNPWWDGWNTFVDLLPSPTGTSGQIISFVSECDLVCLAPSLRSALEHYADGLDRGHWVFGDGCIVPAGITRSKYWCQSELFGTYVATGGFGKAAKKSAKKPANEPAKKSKRS